MAKLNLIILAGIVTLFIGFGLFLLGILLALAGNTPSTFLLSGGILGIILGIIIMQKFK